VRDFCIIRTSMRALTHRAVRAPLLPLPLVAPFALAAIVAIAGCKVGPNPKPLVLSDAEPALPTPADFTPPELTDTERAGDATALSATAADETPDAAAALDRWWTRFNDPKLDALVAQAEAANASIAQALSNVRVAQAQLGLSEAALWPTIAAGAEYQRTKQNFSRLAAQGVDTDPFSVWAYGVAMSNWELDLWGRIRRLVEASESGLRASVDDLRAALVSVRSQTASTYLSLRTVEERLAVTEAAVANLRQTLALAEKKYNAGTTTKLDVNRAQANLDLEEAAIPQLRSALADAKGDLATLCGTSTADIEALLGARGTIPGAPDAIAVGIPAALLERRPDLRAANARYMAAVASIGAAEALHYPALNLGGNLYISSTEFSGLGDWSNRAYSFGPSLSLPLFTGGAINSQILQAKATAEVAFNAWRGTLVRAVAEADVAIASLVLARDADARYEKATASAEDTYRLAKLQYDAGTTTLENLLDIQNQYYRAQDAEVQARGLAARSVVDLCRALGGGWEQDVPASDNASEESKSAVASSRAAEASRSPLVRERDEKAEQAEMNEKKTTSTTETANAPAQP
jgi:NodT family efflux transporter outer membrane factor (OMF) lipoprotein